MVLHCYIETTVLKYIIRVIIEYNVPKEGEIMSLSCDFIVSGNYLEMIFRYPYTTVYVDEHKHP